LALPDTTVRQGPKGRLGVRLGKPLNLRQREAVWGYVFISPWLIGFLVFTLGPMIASLVLSLTHYNITEPPVFIGLQNYVKLLTDDPKFWHSLGITLKYALIAIPLNLVFGFLLAFLLNQKVPMLPFWRTMFYLPAVLAGVAVAILWNLIFNPRYGILNWFLSLVGIHGPGWLASPQWALPALIVMSLWTVGAGMIIYLAGLQSIPTTLYEAAELDGASAWQKAIRITVPLMSPVIFFNLVIGIIGTFQYFTEVYVLTATSTGGLGGPAESTLFYNIYLYSNAFRYLNMGYASAMAWVLFVVVLLLTLLVFRSSSLWVYYEGEIRR
jgi:multiple sugar transport system permease protein